MLFIYLKLCRKYNYHLITNMLLGNNTFDWVMCSLRVSVISVLQSAMPWCLTNPSSMGTGDQARGAGFLTPGWAAQAQQRHRALFAGLGYEGIKHSPVSSVQFVDLS